MLFDPTPPPGRHRPPAGPPGRRYRRLPVLLAVLLLHACGGSEPVLRYEELAPVTPLASALAKADADAGDGDTVSAGFPRPGFEPCADRVRWAWTLVDGDRLHLATELGEEPRLGVVFCRPGQGEGALRLRIVEPGAATADPSGDRLAPRREIRGEPGWHQWEADLGPWSGERRELVLEAELPPGVRLLVSDAYVRHFTPRAAGWSGPPVWVEADDGRGVLAPWEGGAEARQEEGPEEPAQETSRGPQDASEEVRQARQTGGEGDLAGRQILLISLDTLRWDALEARAGDQPLMPRLAELAAEGQVFGPHYSGASWTKPGHATLLTGQPLSVHQVDGGEAALPPSLPTLAEELSEAGLATAGLVHDCVWLNPKFGFHRGFDRYRSIKGGAAPAHRTAVNWIADHRDRPFFFFLHTFDAHSDFHQLPYESDVASTASVEERFGVEGYGCRQGECASGLLIALNERRIAPFAGEDLVLRHLYGAGVQELDAELGRLFDDLREMGVWDDLTVVVTSDHGEMLLEHGDTLHGLAWEPVLRVPLVVKWPRGERAGQRSETPTMGLDVAPTLLSLAGAEPRDLPGVDLRRPRKERTLFAGSFSWWVVNDGGWKGIFFTGGRKHLYHLAEDPQELRELSEERPEELERLEARLDEMQAWSEATRERLSAGQAESGLTPEERERLRSLGYLQ